MKRSFKWCDVKGDARYISDNLWLARLEPRGYVYVCRDEYVSNEEMVSEIIKEYDRIDAINPGDYTS